MRGAQKYLKRNKTCRGPVKNKKMWEDKYFHSAPCRREEKRREEKRREEKRREKKRKEEKRKEKKRSEK